MPFGKLTILTKSRQNSPNTVHFFFSFVNQTEWTASCRRRFQLKMFGKVSKGGYLAWLKVPVYSQSQNSTIWILAISTWMKRSTGLSLAHYKCLNETLCSMALFRCSRYYNHSFHCPRLWLRNCNFCIRDLKKSVYWCC